MAAEVVRISYKELEEIALKNEEKRRLKEERLKELGMKNRRNLSLVDGQRTTSAYFEILWRSVSNNGSA